MHNAPGAYDMLLGQCAFKKCSRSTQDLEYYSRLSKLEHAPGAATPAASAPGIILGQNLTEAI